MADDFNSQYDKPLFGAGGNWQNTGLGGTPATPVPDVPGTSETVAVVTPYASGYQNADRVSVGPDDSQVPSQTDLYQGSDPSLASGIPGDSVGVTGIGHGHTHFGGGSAS